MSNPYRFPRFTGADGGMVATEMMKRLDALAPDYFKRYPHDRARVLLEEIARQEDANDALRAALAERDAQLQHTRNALAEAILQLGGTLELRPSLTPPTWTMRGPERSADGAFVYRVTVQPYPSASDQFTHTHHYPHGDEGDA